MLNYIVLIISKVKLIVVQYLFLAQNLKFREYNLKNADYENFKITFGVFDNRAYSNFL